MVHHVLLCKLKPEVTPAKIEEIMMTTRMTLLKIPEILSVRCGKNIEAGNEWPFFIAVDFESMEKFHMTEEDAIYMKFFADIVRPNTHGQLALYFEMEPGKNIKFS